MNRFDEYIASPYVSQYTPVPFDQIMQVGQKYNEQRRLAEENLTENIKKFGTFTSASAKDVENYNRETIGRMKPLFEEMQTNPEALKDPVFRGRIQGLINSVDYGKLAKYEQTAKNLDAYNKIKAEMKMKGLYNEMWEDPRIANWNTDDPTMGIMNELAPLQYKSIEDMAKEVASVIKPGYITSKGGYDYTGVSKDRIAQELSNNMDTILNTPEARKHIETIMRQTGVDANTAVKEFTNRITSAGSKFAWNNREANEFSKIAYEYSQRSALENAKSVAKQGGQEGAVGLVNMFNAAGRNRYIQYGNKYLSQSKEYADAVNMANSKDPLIAGMGKTALNKITQSYSPSSAFKQIFNKQGKVLDPVKLRNAVNEIKNEFGIQGTDETNSMFEQNIQGSYQNTHFGKRKVIYNTENLKLASAWASKVAGYKFKDDSLYGHTYNKVQNALNNNKLTGLIVTSMNDIISLPSGSGQSNTQFVSVTIPKNQLAAAGLTEQDLIRAGAVKIPKNASMSVSNRYSSDEETVKTTESSRLPEDYYTLELVAAMPSNADEVRTAYTNQAMNKKVMTGNMASEAWGTEANAYVEALMNNE